MFGRKEQKRILGLDIGSSSIKVIEVSVNGNDFVVTGYGQAELDGREPAKVLHELVKTCGFHTKKVVSSVSGREVVARYINMDWMDECDLQNVIKFEADHYIPFELDQVTLDYQRLDQKNSCRTSTEEMKVFLTAAKNSMIDEKLELLRDAGLDSSLLDEDCSALGNAFWLNNNLSPYHIETGKAVALCDIGACSTKINIMSTFTREIYLGGESFTEEIQKRLEVDFQQAEAWKKNPGKNVQEIREAIFPALDDLANEINLSFDYFACQYETEVGEVLLTGGGSLFPDLAIELEKILNVRVTHWNPTENLKIADNVDIFSLRENAPKLAITIGLASRIFPLTNKGNAKTKNKKKEIESELLTTISEMVLQGNQEAWKSVPALLSLLTTTNNGGRETKLVAATILHRLVLSQKKQKQSHLQREINRMQGLLLDYVDMDKTAQFSDRELATFIRDKVCLPSNISQEETIEEFPPQVISERIPEKIPPRETLLWNRIEINFLPSEYKMMKKRLLSFPQINIFRTEKISYIAHKEKIPEKKITRKSVTLPGIPTFERALSEEAGRPGPIEFLATKSVFLMKVIQATIGIKFILLAGLIDGIIKTITTYIHGIYYAWKMSLNVKKNLKRKIGYQKITELNHDLMQSRMLLSRLFCFTGLDLYDNQKEISATFELELVLESRQHLDEMKLDLSFLTIAQTHAFIKNSIKDLLFSFLPNIWDIVITAKDIFILAFVMKYSRRDIEQMYAEMIICYGQVLSLLEQQYQEQNIPKKALPLRLAPYEERLIEATKQKNYWQKKDIEEWIEGCRHNVQRLIQVLSNPINFLEPHRWSRIDLLQEINQSKSNKPLSSKYFLELERWLRKEVKRTLQQKGMKIEVMERTLRKQEANDFQQRYRLQQKLNRLFF